MYPNQFPSNRQWTMMIWRMNNRNTKIYGSVWTFFLVFLFFWNRIWIFFHHFFSYFGLEYAGNLCSSLFIFRLRVRFALFSEKRKWKTSLHCAVFCSTTWWFWQVKKKMEKKMFVVFSYFSSFHLCVSMYFVFYYFNQGWVSSMGRTAT